MQVESSVRPCKCCWFSSITSVICGCSHQGGSRDSGVYSSDSGSSVSQQTSSGSDVFWTDLCHLDKLKVEARAAGLLGVDEGISEVCG